MDVLKFVKMVNVASIGHAVVVCEANAAKEKYVNRMSACVAHNRADVARMNIASTADVFARQVSAINVTIHANQMKFV